jgi:hypothetical protein
MADTKISALPASTTPLAGTEELPIVQNGVTRKVSVANLTAGRAVNATEVTATTGNFATSVAGKGLAVANVGIVVQDYFSGFTSGVAKPVTPAKSSGFMVFVTGYSLSGGYSAILNFGDTVLVASELNTTLGVVTYSIVSNQLNITSTGSASQILQELWVSVIGK